VCVSQNENEDLEHVSACNFMNDYKSWVTVWAVEFSI